MFHEQLSNAVKLRMIRQSVTQMEQVTANWMVNKTVKEQFYNIMRKYHKCYKTNAR